MDLKFDVVKNQKFEWGRTINPALCDCKKCDFLHCPKKNYAVKMKPHKYNVSDFWEARKDLILLQGRNFEFTYDLFTELIGECISFPKGTYWGFGDVKRSSENFGDTIYDGITIVVFTRGGKEIERGRVNQQGDIYDFGLTDPQYALANRISKAIKQVRENVNKEFDRIRGECERKIVKDGNVIGWLDREGNHYPCAILHHSEKAQKLGYTETELECMGWVKIFAPHECYCCGHKTQEQIKWLYDNGVLKDWEVQRYEDQGLL